MPEFTGAVTTAAVGRRFMAPQLQGCEMALPSFKDLHDEIKELEKACHKLGVLENRTQTHRCTQLLLQKHVLL